MGLFKLIQRNLCVNDKFALTAGLQDEMRNRIRIYMQLLASGASYVSEWCSAVYTTLSKFQRRGSMTGLDRNGYIVNDISLSNVQPEFQPAFKLVIDRFLHQFGNLTHSLYLYGSVGRGTAVPYISDLDISVILHQAPRADGLLKMTDLGTALQQLNPIFSKVEFDVGDYDAVMRRNDFEWRFWLKHCCTHVAGDDLRANIVRYRPAMHIGLAINQDVETRYRTAMSQLSTQWDHSVAKTLAKKLIRCDYALLAEKDRSWHVELGQL